MDGLNRQLNLLHPPILEFGFAAAARIGDWARTRDCGRILVIADRFNADRVHQLGLAASATTEVLSPSDGEPDTSDLDSLLAEAAPFRPDLVIGFGGGSAMDLAKLVAVLVEDGQTLAEIIGADQVKGRHTLLAQVPTTSGTGSEAGTRALVTDTAEPRKLAVESRHMLADMVAIDPALTMSLPPAITAATGIDALTHCVEAYTNKKAHPAVDHYALQGIRLAGRYLSRAVENGEDADARAAMCLVSYYGGLCLGPVNTAAGHAVAYPLGTRHHLPHGHANAVIFPHVLAFNTPAAMERTGDILEALSYNRSLTMGPESVRDVVYAFCADLGIEMRLGNLGVPENDFIAMAEEAHAIRRLMDNNPRDLSRDDIVAIYEAAA